MPFSFFWRAFEILSTEGGGRGNLCRDTPKNTIIHGYGKE
jgi:hypothetical protein